MFKFIDVLILPITVVSGLFFKLYRRIGSQKFPRNTALLKKLGVFPIRDHYYEPLFDDSELTKPLTAKRPLPGVDLRLEAQLGLLSELTYQDEFFVREDNEVLQPEHCKETFVVPVEAHAHDVESD